MNPTSRRDVLKAAGAATVVCPLPMASAAARDLSDMAFFESKLAEMREVDNRYWQVEEEQGEAAAGPLWERYNAIGDAIASHVITSPEGALFKARALHTVLQSRELIGGTWAMGDDQRNAMIETVVDWLERQVEEAVS